MSTIEKPAHHLKGSRGSRRARRRASRAKRRARIENLFFGTSLMAAGFVTWGYQRGDGWAESLLDAWPLLLAWIGLGKILAGRIPGGIALLTVGGLAFLHIEGLADLEYTWPLILVAVGVAITLGSLVGRGGPFSDDGAEPEEADHV
ncbi:MAG: hypothetical protein MPN21_07425 [Thermoanaerobaculia bacterium]|nr:hypothetical protein [Thermoanaerobaculia bacterium]